MGNVNAHSSRRLVDGFIEIGRLKLAELLIHRQDCRRVLSLISSRHVGGIRNHGIGGGKCCWISGMVRGMPQRCQQNLQMWQKRGGRFSPRGRVAGPLGSMGCFVKWSPTGCPGVSSITPWKHAKVQAARGDRDGKGRCAGAGRAGTGINPTDGGGNRSKRR